MKYYNKTGQAQSSENLDDFMWSLVGNVINEHEFREEKEIRRGSKHFSPGTKVYCIPEFGGMAYVPFANCIGS